ncbi:MAG: IclR family transcriptional regulator [Peptococcaceae bacterium]|nr:IclR family transcriptional regulator [Peptococcaceae bacterium]
MAIATTFAKGLKVLELFTIERPYLTLRQVAELAKLSKPTALRLLSTLECSGFLMRDNSKAYCLGMKLLELGNFVAERLDVRAVALPHMEELSIRVDQAVNLVIRDGLEGVYIEKRETNHPVRMYTRIGRRAPLYAGACPRALIAFLAERELEQVLSQLTFLPITPTTPASREALAELIRQERVQGYCFSQGELHEGTAAIAMPVRDHHAKVVASISIAGPVGSFVPEKIEYLVRSLQRSARAISHDLGFQQKGDTHGR